MPVVVIAALIFAVSAVSLPSAHSCATEDDARPHLGLMSEVSRNADPEQTPPPVDSWPPLEPEQSPAARQDIAQAPAIVERSAEPAGMPRAVVLVAIAIVVTIGIIEVLFRCTIHERPRSADHRQTE
jgi:hypothetical protein